MIRVNLFFFSLALYDEKTPTKIPSKLFANTNLSVESENVKEHTQHTAHSTPKKTEKIKSIGHWDFDKQNDIVINISLSKINYVRVFFLFFFFFFSSFIFISYFAADPVAHTNKRPSQAYILWLFCGRPKIGLIEGIIYVDTMTLWLARQAKCVNDNSTQDIVVRSRQHRPFIFPNVTYFTFDWIY